MMGVIIMKRVIRISLMVIISVVLISATGFYLYTLDYYKASDYVDEIINSSKVTINSHDGITWIYPEDESADTGIIFYPGGKVEAMAYMPLLIQLAEEGYVVALNEMPLNLAIFNVNGAEDVLESESDVSHWYISGHSLGGAMASVFTQENGQIFDGIILLGAYPTSDISVESLVLYGSNDTIIDISRVSEADHVSVIAGGNHAFFGDYGFQEGDGEALITRQEQQALTVECIKAFINQ